VYGDLLNRGEIQRDSIVYRCPYYCSNYEEGHGITLYTKGNVENKGKGMSVKYFELLSSKNITSSGSFVSSDTRINGDFPGNKDGWPFVYTGSFNPGNLVISGSIVNGDNVVFSANNLNVL
jgi:hypothetical protein